MYFHSPSSRLFEYWHFEGAHVFSVASDQVVSLSQRYNVASWQSVQVFPVGDPRRSLTFKHGTYDDCRTLEISADSSFLTSMMLRMGRCSVSCDMRDRHYLVGGGSKWQFGCLSQQNRKAGPKGPHGLLHWYN